MPRKKVRISTIAAVLLFLQILFACPASERSDPASQIGSIGQQQTEDVDEESVPIQAEFVFELEKPLLPAPMAEKMPDTISRARKPKSKSKLTNNYKYYFYRSELAEYKSLKQRLEERSAVRYEQNRKSGFVEQNQDRYLPNQRTSELDELNPFQFFPYRYEAESVAAHLKATRENAIREACRNNLRLIANAIDSYFRDYPDEIIRSFNQNDVTSLNGRFVKNGYLKEPIKIPEGCRYANEYRLSELISGSQIYCTRHDKP